MTGARSIADAVGTPWLEATTSATLEPMIRLALLDDHPAVLSGLRRLLEGANDMEVLAAAADAVARARALDGRRPHILIVDYDPPRGGLWRHTPRPEVRAAGARRRG